MILAWAVSPAGAWTLAVSTTLLAALESAAVPWAPFLIAYALVLPWPALASATARFGNWHAAFASRPGLVALFALAILAWETVVMGLLYDYVVRRLGRGRPERLSPTAAMDALMIETGRRRGLSPRAVQAWSGIYFLLWAPLAEEMFFWGYLYPVWRPAYGGLAAAALVAAWFAARHGLHFLFLPRPYPWPAGLAFMVSAGGAGFGNGLLFEACGSLWPLIVLHFASNLLSLALTPGPGRPERRKKRALR